MMMRAASLSALLTSCTLVTAVPDDSTRPGAGGSDTGASSQGAGPQGGGPEGGGGAGAGGPSTTTGPITGGNGGGGGGGGSPFQDAVVFAEFGSTIEAIALREGRGAVLIAEQPQLLCFFEETDDDYNCVAVPQASTGLVIDAAGFAYTARIGMPVVDRWAVDSPGQSQAQASAPVANLYVDGSDLLAVPEVPGYDVTTTDSDLQGSIVPLLDVPSGASPRGIAADLLFYYVVFEPAAMGAPNGLQTYARSSLLPQVAVDLSTIKAMATHRANISPDVFMRSVSGAEAATYRWTADEPTKVCDSASGDGVELEGLAADEEGAYMIVDGPEGYELQRFANAVPEPCVTIATNIVTPGPIAVGASAVLFADGSTLYRILKD